MTGPGPVRADVLLERLERRALVFCAAAAAGALVVTGGAWRFSLAVLVGGGLMWLSYRTIRGSIEGLAALATGVPAPVADGDGAVETAPDTDGGGPHPAVRRPLRFTRLFGVR